MYSVPLSTFGNLSQTYNGKVTPAGNTNVPIKISQTYPKICINKIIAQDTIKLHNSIQKQYYIVIYNKYKIKFYNYPKLVFWRILTNSSYK